jgi:hypothetical protein
VIRTSNGLAALFGRLTDPQDRETYAALISFVDSLPKGDEIFKIVELLGLLSLIAQRVPEALGEFLAELRAQTSAAKDYHGQVDARLAALPQEIAAGVDPVAVARAMSENFRQQLSQTGLQDTAQLLKIATEAINRLSADLIATLKPAAAEYSAIVATIGAEVKKLDGAARVVAEHNARLVARERSNRWMLTVAAVFIAFLVGGLAGIVLEKRQTTDLLSNIGAQIEKVQTQVLPIAAASRKNGKQSGL